MGCATGLDGFNPFEAPPALAKGRRDRYPFPRRRGLLLPGAHEGEGMDWSMWGAIGEISGAIAAVSSLVYVGRQVRLGNALARAEAYRSVSTAMSTLTREWARDPLFIPVVRQGILGGSAGIEDFSPDDQTRAILHLATAVRVFETVHRQVEARILGPEAYDMLGGLMFRNQLFRDVWPHLHRAYAPDFALFMEERFDLHPTEPKSSIDTGEQI